MMHKAWSRIEEVPYCFSRSSVKFQGHTALKIVEFDLDLADKSLGRNGIELEMQMFPDDLPLANIDADGYCCHFMRSSVRPTIHGLGFVSIELEVACPTIWGSKNRFFFFIFFSKVRFGAKEGGSHYWEMAVAITCGYGGYLLPLLAAHSSLFRRLTMVRRKDIAGLWAYFLSLFDIFIYDINSTILISNLIPAVKSLLIELSSGTKYEYIIGLNTELAENAYSVLNIVYTHYWVPATLL